jgi:pyridoxal phosphate enzyme (YggS family)
MLHDANTPIFFFCSFTELLIESIGLLRETTMVKERLKELMAELPPGVRLVGAAKTRTPDEILEAVEAGLEIVGENYVQEAERAFQVIGRRVKWHMIGHLQSNKAKKAVRVFDMIETVSSMKLALELDKACEKMSKVMPILIEINSGEEDQKSGVMPGEAAALIQEIRPLRNVKVMGLMTMGPFAGDPEESRPYFQKTRKIFDEVKAMNLPGVEMEYLSMGMSNSYKVALEVGANIVRIGTRLFGERSA